MDCDCLEKTIGTSRKAAAQVAGALEPRTGPRETQEDDTGVRRTTPPLLNSW